jgi:hypothetical protein
MKLKCIKECIMIQDGRSTTTVGKIYETIGDYIYVFMIIDDEGDLHSFNKEDDEYGLSYKFWFEEVRE